MKLSRKLIQEVPEEVIISFFMLRELQESTDEFDEKLIYELDEKINSLSAQGVTSFEDLTDLTPLLGMMNIKGLKKKTAH